MSETHRKAFSLKVHGRVLEHLGIQMYQSPVNALAELVANAWDAEAEEVSLTLPASIKGDATIEIRDNGIGMSNEDCQNKYLNVGWNRRGGDPAARTQQKNRQVLGRKGIGKFAGFGIAHLVIIDTIDRTTGEHTVFELDLDDLLSSEYIGKDEKKIPILQYEGPDKKRAKKHGTTVRLCRLKLTKAISLSGFPKSLARRFLLHQRASDFRIVVNGSALPEALSLEKIQFSYPRDYIQADKPQSLVDVDQTTGWGTERLDTGQEIRWRFMFHKEPIDDEELRGVSVFANGKIIQTPFLFNISGGLGGQHGVEYLTGQVDADYLDLMPDDVVATERQRVDWDHESAIPLLNWGQDRTKSLLRLWQSRRAEYRMRQLDERVARFSARLDKFSTHEVKTVDRALRKLAQVSTLDDTQFGELGEAILLAFEKGRLTDLINGLASSNVDTAEDLLGILIESDVLTALHLAEIVRTKLETIAGLKHHIENKELENAVRDYIAENPWLISPEWQTYSKESSLGKIIETAAKKAKLPIGKDKEQQRVDLVMASGRSVLVLEFMRPGLKLDYDHLGRFELYFRSIKTQLSSVTGGPFDFYSGYVIADELDRDATMIDKLKALAAERMYALNWEHLLQNAARGWEELQEALATREPRDDRITGLIKK